MSPRLLRLALVAPHRTLSTIDWLDWSAMAWAGVGRCAYADEMIRRGR